MVFFFISAALLLLYDVTNKASFDNIRVRTIYLFIVANYGEVAALTILNKGVEEGAQPTQAAQIMIEPINLQTSLRLREGNDAKVPW